MCDLRSLVLEKCHRNRCFSPRLSAERCAAAVALCTESGVSASKLALHHALANRGYVLVRVAPRRDDELLPGRGPRLPSSVSRQVQTCFLGRAHERAREYPYHTGLRQRW